MEPPGRVPVGVDKRLDIPGSEGSDNCGVVCVGAKRKSGISPVSRLIMESWKVAIPEKGCTDPAPMRNITVLGGADGVDWGVDGQVTCSGTTAPETNSVWVFWAVRP